MKLRYLIFLLGPALAAWGDDPKSNLVLDLGANKAVVLENAISPDGHYAVGWTILVKHKSAKPVDWSKWGTGEPIDFITEYVDPDQDPTDKDDYQFTNCIIDLKGKSLVALPSSGPYHPQKPHGYFGVMWSPAGHGLRYALINNDERFSTDNVWLVVLDGSSMHATDLADALNKSVNAILREKRPLNFGSYENTYPLANDEKKNPFAGSVATIPFACDIPRSADDTEVDGTVTIHLPNGTITKTTSDAVTDDPFTQSPALAKADKELNEVYAKVLQKIPASLRADFKKQQLDWIDQRDDNAKKAQEAADQQNNSKDTTSARNKSMLDDTDQRIKDLRERLK